MNMNIYKIYIYCIIYEYDAIILFIAFEEK